MEKNRISEKVVFLPVDFYTAGNVSIYSLLKKTGYFSLYNEVSETNIVEVLNQYPENIDSWLSWSENKRSSSGWYFSQNKNKTYEVGYFPTSDDFKTVKYSDKIKACAAFIKREIEEIRKS